MPGCTAGLEDSQGLQEKRGNGQPIEYPMPGKEVPELKELRETNEIPQSICPENWLSDIEAGGTKAHGKG